MIAVILFGGLFLLSCGKQEEGGAVASPAKEKETTEQTPSSDEESLRLQSEASESAAEESVVSESSEASKEGEEMSQSPEDLFGPKTLDYIESFFDDNPDVDSITSLIGNKQFQSMREGHLPDWDFGREMGDEFKRSLQTVAAAQGVDPDDIGDNDNSPQIDFQIPRDDDSLSRIVGYVIESRGSDFTAELKRVLGDATIQSVIDPDSGPIKVTPKGP